MFYRNHQKIQQRKAKLLERLGKKQKKMNQDIHIRDLFIYPQCEDMENSHGERDLTSLYAASIPVKDRLLDHIELLANIANSYHQKEYCERQSDGHFRIQPGCLNKVTRLSLSEFSLYTHEPIAIDDLGPLLEQIENIAKKQQANVHLLLSSIAIKTKDEKILNMSFYVQCGAEPKIEVFSKGRSSTVDIMYEDAIKFSQQDYINDNTSNNISGFVAPTEGGAISNNTVFTVQTAGNAVYTQAIDVCFDHRMEHAKSLIKKTAAIEMIGDDAIIPDQVDHLLASNSINIISSAKISESIVQIDPIDRVLPTIKDRMRVSDFKNIKNKKYSTLSMTQEDDGSFLLSAPPFGSNFKVVAQKERKLSGFSNDLKEVIKDKNKKTKESTLEQLLRNNSAKSELAVYETLKWHHLHRTLLNKCQSGFFERLFNTQSHKVKSEALKVINNSYLILNKLSQNPEVGIQMLDVFKRDLIFNLENINNGIPHTVSRQLIALVNAESTELTQNANYRR